MDYEETATEVLDRLADGTAVEAAFSKALFEGAGSVANQLKTAIAGMKTQPFRYMPAGYQREASPEERELLMHHIGIGKFGHNDDGVSTGVGFDGYGTLGAKKVPAIVIARGINSGTSFRVKRPFVRKAAKGADRIIAEALDAELKKTIGE